MQAAGHEMVCHGNVHEGLDTLDAVEERSVLREQLAIYERYLGIRPKGYRSPRLIRVMQEQSGVWFATAMQVAEWAESTNQDTSVRLRVHQAG